MELDDGAEDLLPEVLVASLLVTAVPPIELVALALPAVSVLLPVGAVLAIPCLGAAPVSADRSVLDEGGAGVTFAVLLPAPVLAAASSFLPQADSDRAAAAERIRTHERAKVRELISGRSQVEVYLLNQAEAIDSLLLESNHSRQ